MSFAETLRDWEALNAAVEARAKLNNVFAGLTAMAALYEPNTPERLAVIEQLKSVRSTLASQQACIDRLGPLDAPRFASVRPKS